MRIERIELRNYRAFRRAALTALPNMAVVVGANGSGKSTLFDVFAFLKDSLSGNVAAAVARRGGFRELVSRGEQGPVGITIKFRETGGRLATYLLEVAQEAGRVVVQREVLRYRRGQNGKPWHFVDFRRGAGTAVTNESVYGEEGAVEKREEYTLDDPSVLAIKGLGQFRGFRVVSEFRSLIENWYIPDFHIADARPSAERLSRRGDHVTQVAQYLFENHRDIFDRILEAMRLRVPGVEKIEAKLTDDGRLALRFRDGHFHDPFAVRPVSGGVIRMFSWLVLLHDPKPHPCLVAEEPARRLYPMLLPELAEEFRGYTCRGGQAFVSTHSPDFLNGTNLDEIFWLVKEDGFATVRRVSESETLRNLVREGDLPGALWRQGVFEGAHRSPGGVEAWKN